jgi:ornithine--oxo-acid transaminase
VSEFDLPALIDANLGGELDLHAATVNPQFVRVLRTIGFDRHWARASGAYLYDTDGNRYLDMLGGYGMFNVGRNNQTVRKALTDALALETPGSVQLGVGTLPAVLAQQLLALAPPSVHRVVFTNTGTEAVEAALKLGRAASGRSRVVSADHAFHGLTLGSLSANGNAEFTNRFGPLLPGFDKVPFNDLEAMESELRREDVALVLLEPLQGKGIVLPEPGYLEGVQELCRRYGTLFCVDEVLTGFGRTGKMFASDHFGLEPDLMTVAKSLSGGYVPTGACLISQAIFDRVFDSMEHAVVHGSTFAPNDLAIVAGLATLHELEAQDLVARAARTGELLLERTRPLVESYDVVQEVRGLGLAWAIEFHEPEQSRLSWRMLERLQQGLFSQLVAVPLFSDHRVLIQVSGHRQNVLRALPPLTLSEEDVDYFADALEQTVAAASKMPRALMRFATRAVRAGRSSDSQPRRSDGAEAKAARTD